jgi:hypothetical protein
MEVARSFTNHRKYAYEFTRWEEQHIAAALPARIKIVEKKILKIENNPDNEGQATYAEEIRHLRYEIVCLQEIINQFA